MKTSPTSAHRKFKPAFLTTIIQSLYEVSGKSIQCMPAMYRTESTPMSRISDHDSRTPQSIIGSVIGNLGS